MSCTPGGSTGTASGYDYATIAHDTVTSTVLAMPRPGVGRLGLNVHTDIQPATLDGDPLLIQRMAASLIDNAVHHNIPGGDIQVATGTSGGRAVLSVANSGQEIPPAEVSRLFQPFRSLGVSGSADAHSQLPVGISRCRVINVRARPGRRGRWDEPGRVKNKDL